MSVLLSGRLGRLWSRLRGASELRVELARVARAMLAVERARRDPSPARAVALMRARGARTIERGPAGRARLVRAIGWVDALAGANCYRRVLLELSLDRGAARETIVFGLDVGSTGHVAFKGREEMRFDVAFEVGPDIAAADGRAAADRGR